MKFFKICFLLLCFSAANVFSQSSCATSAAFCANNTSGTTFPAGVNNGTAQTGPNYGCLFSQPNPAWYYFQVSQAGSIVIGIGGTGGFDVDFICWGPFTSPTGNCGNLTAGNTVDCSYSSSATETCTINNAIVGQYYELLITNYSNLAQNINFNQIAGTGSTNCNLIAPVTSATMCAGSSATISANTNLLSPTFSWTPGGLTTPTIVVSPTATTVYTLTVNGTNASGTATTVTNTGTVTVNSLPVITVPSTLTMCENVNAAVNSTISPAGAYSYSWSTGATTSNISVNTSTVVSVTATNTSNGCVSNVATCSVTALPSPTVTTYPVYYVCGGATGTVVPNVTGGTPSYTYSWSPVALGTGSTALVSSNGTYTVQVTDQNSCVGSTQFTVSTTQPTISIVASPYSICATNASTLSPSLLGADSYTWSTASNNDSISVTTPGVYSLTISVNSCTASASTTISASPIPTVTIPNSVGLCSGGSASLTPISISPSATYSYSWSTGATTSTINVNNLDTLVTLIVTDVTTGCSSNVSNTCSVVTASNPTVTTFPVYNICAGSSATVTPIVTGGSPVYSFSWTPGSLGTDTMATVSGAGVYSVQVTDQHSCVGSTQFTVSTSQPTLSINVNPTMVCGAGTSTLTTTYPGATTYSWSTGSTNDTIMVNTGGVYSVSITVNSCTASATNTFVINPTPTVTIPASVSMCSGASNTVAAIPSPAGAYTYTWSNGAHTPSLTVSTPTALTLQVTNLTTGCVSLVSNSCAVIAVPNPTVTMSAIPIVFCTGFNATLTPTVMPGGSTSYSYAWSPSGLGTASTATTSSQGIFSVLVTDANLCSASTTVAAIMSSPSVNLFSPDLIICPGDCSDITAVGTSSFTPYNYSWSTGPQYIGDSTVVCSAGVVTVTFKDAKGCIVTNSITVVDDVVPVASFTATPPSPVTPGQLIDFTSTSTIATGTITSFVWTFGDGNGAIGTPVDHSYVTAGTFPIILTVTGSNGCKNSYTVNYEVDAIIELPNVFTPNGDGANEFLKFKNLELLGSNHLTIFNRWGKKVFEQDNYKNDWNGGGHTEGTYFFILTVPEATPNNYNGYVQLMR